MTVEKPSVKFFPGFFLDVVERDAQYNAGELPRRITLFPSLQQRYSPSYSDELREAVHPLAPFGVTVGGTAWFGDSTEPQLVRRIEPSAELQSLHTTLVRVLGHLMHDRHYRQPYRPHISINHEEEIAYGTIIHIAGFSVVEKIQGQPWTIVDKIRLRGDDNEITS